MSTSDRRDRVLRRAERGPRAGGRGGGVRRGIAVVAACALVLAGGATAASAATPRGSAGCGKGLGVADLPKAERPLQIVHTPDGYRDGHPVPVVVAFHGAKRTPRDMETYSDLDRADAVVVYPEGSTYPENGKDVQGWAPNDHLPDRNADLDYVTRLVEQVKSTLCVDAGPVFATGKSQGGGFTYLLACKRPDEVAAIAPVAGAFYRPGPVHHGVASCDSGPRNVLEIHGDHDGTATYDGRTTDGTQQGRTRAIRTVGDDRGWVDEWVARDGCGAEDPTPADEPRNAHVHRWSGCTDGTAVEHYRIIGGDHNWPGSDGPSGPGDQCVSDVQATRVVLDFFGIGSTAEPRTRCGT